ncbi:hypothetical protein [Pseudobacteriovorax antillogorgiicola]|uniref:Uncharacterized protein n=1 Tax=Pseudobacteriovorax antillogorgiicola TaxID=1513793 RepID=A0A1Y6BSY3_9BACT|nr:hypothetical protein [Pseudobacteriovorax antillogorgiicola]TCS53140.1 hypothetical protein EDD56_108191 [Pseudobacteriovorax antillogorgiicola]SMF25280.1 hypothetical protein SAMN06296036_10855 [Pseudobacteriovorax antillogorgiicola]
MDKSLKRISLLVRDDQYEALNQKGLNLSGLVRDLIDDYLSDHKITLSVSEDTRSLYDRIISNSGSSDQDLEVYFRQALEGLLDAKIKEMQALKKEFKT